MTRTTPRSVALSGPFDHPRKPDDSMAAAGYRVHGRLTFRPGSIDPEGVPMRKWPYLTVPLLVLCPFLVANDLAKSVPGALGDLSKVDRVFFVERFRRQIWPMMTEPDVPEKGCIACHRDDESNTSGL